MQVISRNRYKIPDFVQMTVPEMNAGIALYSFGGLRMPDGLILLQQQYLFCQGVHQLAGYSLNRSVFPAVIYVVFREVYL